MIPEGLFGLILGWILQNIKDQGWPGWMPFAIAAASSVVVAVLMAYAEGGPLWNTLLVKLLWVFGSSQAYSLASKAAAINKQPPFGRPDKE